MHSHAINTKSITTLDIQGVYDVVVAYFTQNPGLVGPEAEIDQEATIALEQALTTIKHQRVGNTHALITSHKAALARGKRTPATPQDLRPEALKLATLAIGTSPLPQQAPPESAPSDQATPQPLTAPLPVHPDTPMTSAPIDAVITSMTGQDLTLAAILEARTKACAARDEAQAALAQDPLAGAPFQAPPKSGFASLVQDHPMAPAVDALLAGAMPGETWKGLIGQIARAEDEAAAAAQKDEERRVAAQAAQAATTRTQLPAAPAPAAITPYQAQPSIAALDASVQVHMQPGNVLFPSAYGAPVKILSFPVPTLAFDQPHPDVPAIDPTYKFSARVVLEALQALADGDIMWLYGDSGCGKSEFWKQMAAHTGMPFTRMNMDGHLTRGDIIGVNRMVPNADKQMEMRFIDGILPRAMARPGLLLIDEIDLGDPEIMAVLQPVLEGEPLRILEDHGRIVHPHPQFRIAVTGNTIGLGSDTNAYLNAFEQSAATRDRIGAFVHMPYMPPSVEKSVLMQRIPGVDEVFVERLIKLANKVREAYAQGGIHQIFSTRATQTAARRYQRLAPLYTNPKDATMAVLETVILNRMDSSSRAKTVGFIDNIFA